ncbi:MAG: UDP-glucose 4-epimerase GalE [Myxococcales bacterium]|nr:UDP-glucose 4-epimerase GalE [Myxococcales bacterium]
MRILVTGGAGYVGSFAARHLMRKGHHVVVLDNLCQGHRGTLPAEVLVVGDIADRALFGRLLDEHRIEAVMHFAAATNVAESVENPAYHYRNNTVNTLGMLETMIEHDVRRIVFSSTAATYGETDEMPLREDAPKNPVCPYGYSKLAIEWMIQDFSHAYGLSYAILRYFNASGAAPDGAHGEDHAPETHLIPLVIQAMTGKRPEVQLFGSDYPTRDGTALRDYVHVDDLALAHELAVEWCPAPGSKPGGGIFNIGTGSGNTVLEVVQALERVTGEKVPYRMAARRPGDPARLVASNDRLRDVLGWRPAYTEIDAVVETAWKWHRAHPNGYGD